MEGASILNQISENWLLVFLFTLFIGAVFWAFRPGSGATHRDASDIPFRHDDHPASRDSNQEARP